MMRLIKTGLAVALFTVTSSQSIAQTNHEKDERSPALKICMENSSGVTADMRACLDAEYKRLDLDLNVTYASVMKQLKTKDLKTRLVNSQRAWIWRRDSYCKGAVERSGTAGGTASSLVLADCRITMVRKRIAWLKKVPKNPGYLSKV
jgi:uncharacterized protein YecT (DUF1311 family)